MRGLPGAGVRLRQVQGAGMSDGIKPLDWLRCVAVPDIAPREPCDWNGPGRCWKHQPRPDHHDWIGV